MRTRTVLRAILLLALVLVLGLELLLWVRSLGIVLLQEAYPSAGATEAGEPVTFYLKIFRGEDGVHPGYRYEMLDAQRRVTRTVVHRPGEVSGPPPFVVSSMVHFADAGSPPERLDDPLFVVRHAPGRRAEPWWRRIVFELDRYTWEGGRSVGHRWTHRDGRFLCVDRSDGSVRAGFGPGGFVEGPEAAEGPGFKELHVVLMEHLAPGESAQLHAVLCDPYERAMYDLRVDPSLVPADDPGSVVPVKVERHSFRDVPAEPGRQVKVLSLVETGDERLLVASDGAILGRTGIATDEFVVHATGATLIAPGGANEVPTIGGRLLPHLVERVRVVLLTLPKPVDPTRAILRWRFLHASGGESVAEIDLVPVTALEKLLAGLALLPDLARPLPLAAVSMASAPPDTWEELNAWWWRTPALADGRRPALFALSLLVAAACAVLARRSARVRCRTPLAVRAWIVVVLLLGPFGLLWMRLCLPRTRIEAVADGRRAAHLDTAPAGAAPWPAPAPLGIEVTG